MNTNAKEKFSDLLEKKLSPILTWTDTHVHLTDKPIFEHLAENMQLANQAGIGRFVIPGYKPFSWHRSMQIWKNHPTQVRRAVGLHPLFLKGYELDVFSPYWEAEGLHAIGEIGLDNRSENTLEEQEFFFRHQLEFAIAKKLPVIIHCVGLVQKTYDILADYRGQLKGVMHSLSTSLEMTRLFLDLGLHISFSGALTFAKRNRVREMAAYVPLDFVLLETDAPYVGNVQHKLGESLPIDFIAVLSAFSEIRKQALEEFHEILEQNAQNLFFTNA